MVDTDPIVSMLEAKREDLSKQLDAIDRAIAALRSVQSAEVDARSGRQEQTPEVVANATPPVSPTRVKAKRVLGESHKEALSKGQRKAREAKDVAAGLAREMPDDSFVPALAPRSGKQLPQLIKKQRS